MGTRQREKEREGMKGERERVVAHARPALCTITAGEQTVDALVVRLSGGAVPAPCRSPRAHPPTACVFWSQLRTARLATSAKRGVLLASAVRAACARSSVLFCVQPCFACPMHVHTYFTQCISRNCIGAALCTITAGEQTVDAFVVLLSGGGCAGTVSLAPCPSSHRVCVLVAVANCPAGYFGDSATGQCGTCCLCPLLRSLWRSTMLRLSNVRAHSRYFTVHQYALHMGRECGKATERGGGGRREREWLLMRGSWRPAPCTVTAGEQTVAAFVVLLSGGAVPAPCRSPRVHPPTACVFWSQLRTARLATSATLLLASAVRAACARSSVLFCAQPCSACPATCTLTAHSASLCAA